jgi:hypothetical protein
MELGNVYFALGPTCQGEPEWVGLDPIGFGPTHSIARHFVSSPRLTLASAPTTSWSPPPSPICPGRLRPSSAVRFVAFTPPLNGAPDGLRRSAFGGRLRSLPTLLQLGLHGDRGDFPLAGVPGDAVLLRASSWWCWAMRHLSWHGLAWPGAAVRSGLCRRGRHDRAYYLLRLVSAPPCLSLACSTSFPSSGCLGIHGPVPLLLYVCWFLLLCTLACYDVASVAMHVLLLCLCCCSYAYAHAIASVVALLHLLMSMLGCSWLAMLL